MSDLEVKITILVFGQAAGWLLAIAILYWLEGSE